MFSLYLKRNYFHDRSKWTQSVSLSGIDTLLTWWRAPTSNPTINNLSFGFNKLCVANMASQNDAKLYVDWFDNYINRRNFLCRFCEAMSGFAKLLSTEGKRGMCYYCLKLFRCKLLVTKMFSDLSVLWGACCVCLNTTYKNIWWCEIRLNRHLTPWSNVSFIAKHSEMVKIFRVTQNHNSLD